MKITRELNNFQKLSAISALLLIFLVSPSGCGGAKSESERLKEEITDINAENEKLKRELSTLKSENSKMHVRVAQLHLEIAALHQEIQNMQRDLEVLKAQLKGAEKKNKKS